MESGSVAYKGKLLLIALLFRILIVVCVCVFVRIHSIFYFSAVFPQIYFSLGLAVIALNQVDQMPGSCVKRELSVPRRKKLEPDKAGASEAQSPKNATVMLQVADATVKG